MKKFSKFDEEKINENKVYSEYMRLSDIFLSKMSETLDEEGIKMTDDIKKFLIIKSEEVSKGVIDPTTISFPGEQTNLDF